MTISRQSLCIVYAIIALIALIGTWGNVIEYFKGGFISGTLLFWEETMINPASRFITVDVLFLGLAATVWALLEANRLKIRGAWIYILGGVLIAASVAAPLFMIHRERALINNDSTGKAGTLRLVDLIGLVSLAALFFGYTYKSLTL